MRIYATYTELLERVEQSGRSMRVLGHTLDGAPMVAVRTGGEKEPAIFITAGSHSTEQAGVSAAVELIEQLDTAHQVYVVPTRDPIGLNGFAYALSLGLGEKPGELNSFEQVEAILRSAGEVLFDENDMVLSLIGEYGYASSRPAPERICPQWFFYRRLRELEKAQPEVVAPLQGRRIYMTPGQEEVQGSGNFGRAYTLIVSPDGEVLHLNRFHDTAWAPVEARCARQLMAEIRPAISFDVHESQMMEDRYWLSARHQQDAENEAWAQRIARTTIQAIADGGGKLAADQDVVVLSTPWGVEGRATLEDTWFRRSEKGVYWLDAGIRGEGLNLADFAARFYGLAFGTEMGMYGSFEHRVAMGMLTVQSAVAVFEERYK
jgi:hypothetical protein